MTCIDSYGLPSTLSRMITYWSELKEIYDDRGFENLHLEDDTEYDSSTCWTLFGERLETDKEQVSRLAKEKRTKERQKKQKQKEIDRIKKLAKKYDLVVTEKK